VVAREQLGATDTPLDIVKRLITRKSARIQSGEQVRTRCLPHNGGKQLVKYYLLMIYAPKVRETLGCIFYSKKDKNILDVLA